MMLRGRALVAALHAAMLLVVAGCGTNEPRRGDAGVVASAAPGDEGKLRPAVTLLDSLAWCDIDHRGLLLDLGSEAMVGRYGHALGVPPGVVGSAHNGASWARVYEPKLELTFRLPEVMPLFVAMRIIGRGARSVSISLDSTPLGLEKLVAGEVRTVSTAATRLPVDAGLHRVVLVFRGGGDASGEPYAEIDWVRIGVSDELTRTYGAPTLFDVLVPAAQLGGVPHRALAMRAPGSLRCPVRVPPYGRLRVSVGMRGDGRAVAAVWVREDGREGVLLERVAVEGGASAGWHDLDLSLHPFAGRIVSLELEAQETTGTGRLSFGDPELLVPDRRAPRVPRARSAVIVVLDGVARSDLPPWREGGAPHLPTLNQLTKSATVFMEHRAPSTLVAASLATLLTGLPPPVHSLLDGGARLPKAAVTMGDIARDSSVRTSMFTGVPTSFELFGFAPHWESFSQYPPNEGRLASAPFDDAARWLTDTTQPAEGAPAMLALLHARGGHPPWDVTPPDAARLPPPGYTGNLRPRDAAESLAALQGRHRRLSEADLTRLNALYFAASSGQDEALGKLVMRLEEAGRWDSTLLVVTGDVASARSTLFADGLPLDEELLALPLYVHFPNGLHAGARVAAPTEMADLTHTVLRSLGLKPPADGGGHDLAALAAGIEPDGQHLRVAYGEQQFSARWGDFVLTGQRDGRSPKLCELPVDASCAFDRSILRPIVAQALFRRLAEPEGRARQRLAREPITLDSESASHLKIWGAL